MKRFLFVAALVFGGCAPVTSVPSTPTEPTFKKVIFSGGVKDIICVHKSDFYDDLGGRYMINVMLRNTGKVTFTSLELTALYYNALGKEIAYSKSRIFQVMAPGDSSVVQIQSAFQTVSDLPDKIILKVNKK